MKTQLFIPPTAEHGSKQINYTYNKFIVVQITRGVIDEGFLMEGESSERYESHLFRE